MCVCECVCVSSIERTDQHLAKATVPIIMIMSLFI